MMWLFIAGGVLTGVIGDVLSKRWLMETNDRLAASALLVYIIGCFCWFGLLRRAGNSLAKAGAIWTVSQCVVAVMVGMLIFGEVLDFRARVGVFLGILSVVLLT